MELNKSKLLDFILKYNLDASSSGKTDNAVKIKSDGTNIETNFITADKSLLGEIKFANVGFPDGEYGIYETTKLEAFLKVLQDTFHLEVSESFGRPVNFQLKDDVMTAEFYLADLDVIPKAPTLQREPDYEVCLELTKLDVDNILKAKRALPESQHVGFTSDSNGNVTMVINYVPMSSVNNIKLNFTKATDAGLSSTVVFNLNQLIDILNANKNAMGKVYVSTGGMLKAQFVGEEFTSTYYLVAMQDI